MIVIVNNGQSYSSRRVYFVDVPTEHVESFVAALVPNTNELPHVIGIANEVAWYNDYSAHTIDEFVSGEEFSHDRDQCDGELYDDSCTCWLSHVNAIAKATVSNG